MFQNFFGLKNQYFTCLDIYFACLLQKEPEHVRGLILVGGGGDDDLIICREMRLIIQC